MMTKFCENAEIDRAIDQITSTRRYIDQRLNESFNGLAKLDRNREIIIVISAGTIRGR